MNEFSLLEFLGVDDGTKQLTKQEVETSKRKAKQRFNEYQFQAHVEQERAKKHRVESSQTGRSVRGTHQQRDHHHGNFWFAQGSIPTSHDNVGTTAVPPATILHPLDATQPALSTSSGVSKDSQWEYDTNQANVIPNMSAPKPAIVIRPKLPPPPPKLSYGPPSARGTAAPLSPQQRVLLQIQQQRMVPSPLPAPGTPRSTTVTQPPANTEFTHQPQSPGGDQSFLAAPTSVSGSNTPVAAKSQGRSRTPTGGSSRKNIVAPYAEHYDADALYDVDQPIRDFTLGGFQMDRRGIPRGRQGVDHEEGKAREAQRLGEAMRLQNEIQQKKDRQDLLKQQLDHLVDIKRDQRIQERERDDRSVYGYTLPGMEKDIVAARDRRKLGREELERVWQKQALERDLQRQAEEEYYRPEEEDWEGLHNAMDTSRQLAQETPAAVQSAAQQAWVGAWQEHQNAEGNIKVSAEKDRQRMEAQELKPHIANYSDRILLMEKARKEQQEAYKRDLDEQVKQRQYAKGQQIVNNYRRDHQFHRPPFVTYGDGFH